MKLSFRIFPALLLCCLLLCSCGGRRGRIIPRATMADIYADMFLADQWLNDHASERKTADTSLFYDPIFRRYGYSYEDFDASVRHYLKDPEKFAKVFRNASQKLKDMRDDYRRKAEMLEQVREFNASIKGYSARDFLRDTIIWRSPYKDSMRRYDSLLRDSLLRDSLLRDSLRIDSLRLDSLRRDSLLRDLRVKNRPAGELIPDGLHVVASPRRDSLQRKRAINNTIDNELY